MSSKIPATLKKVLEAHLPFDSSSARAIQRTAALHIGHETRGGKIEPDALRDLCEALSLFDIEAGEGTSGRYKGTSTFAANFSQNMKKDDWLFEGSTGDGWKLTATGKAEAKRVFDKGEAPAKRRPSAGGSKPKAKPKAKSKAKPKKKAKAKPKKATKAKPSSSRTKKKAAQRRKKREGAKPAATPAPAPEGVTAS